MKKKQQNQRIQKKKEQHNHLDNLATNEEEEMHTMFQKPEPRNQRIQQSMNNEEEDEEKDYQIADIRKQDQNHNSDQISEMVLSLFHKNKINEKNAFDVPLINITDLSVFKKIDAAENAWKQISANLDAGSKIYGYRVDLVHQHTYKVLGGLHRTNINLDNDKQQEEGKEQEQEQLRKKRIANTGGENTLEKNISNLDTIKFDLEFEIDPLFQQTSAKFDEAGAKGLLLNNLPINENLVLALDSELVKDGMTNQNAYIKDNFDFSSLRQLKDNIQDILKSKLCPELGEFKEDLLTRTKQLFDEKVLNQFNNPTLQGPLYGGDFNPDYIDDEQMFMNEMDQFGEENNLRMNFQPPIDEEPAAWEPQEDENSMNQLPENQFVPIKIQDDSDDIQKKFNLHKFEGALAQIGTGKIFASERENLAWMDFNVIQQPTKQNRKPVNEQVQKKNTKTKQKKKSDLPFNFRENEIFEINKVLGLDEVKKKPKIKQEGDYKQLSLLPRIHQIEKQNLMDLFSRSILTVRQKQSKVEIEDDQVEIISDNGDMPMMNQDDIQDMPLIQGAFTQNMQSQPFVSQLKQQNQRITVPIKELKVKVWNQLHKGFPEYSPKIKGYEFSNIPKLLPQVLEIPESRLKVSIQTCFVTMLHLANEEKLRFLQTEKEDDFLIYKE